MKSVVAAQHITILFQKSENQFSFDPNNMVAVANAEEILLIGKSASTPVCINRLTGTQDSLKSVLSLSAACMSSNKLIWAINGSSILCFNPLINQFNGWKPSFIDENSHTLFPFNICSPRYSFQENDSDDPLPPDRTGLALLSTLSSLSTAQELMKEKLSSVDSLSSKSPIKKTVDEYQVIERFDGVTSRNVGFFGFNDSPIDERVCFEVSQQVSH